MGWLYLDGDESVLEEKLDGCLGVIAVINCCSGFDIPIIFYLWHFCQVGWLDTVVWYDGKSKLHGCKSDKSDNTIVSHP